MGQLHQEVSFEDEVCTVLAAQGWLYQVGDAQAYDRARALFPRAAHPVTQGFDAESLRDWSGSATLLPPHLLGLPDAETHDPKWRWCGFENTRVWRCCSRGSAASESGSNPAAAAGGSSSR